MYVDRLHHRPPAADHCPFSAYHGPTALDDRHVRRGATHVGHGEIRELGQETRTDHTRRRTRQHRLHRVFEGDFRADQGPIAAHDHDRGGYCLAREHRSERFQQMSDLGCEARIQRSGQCALGRIELGAQLVTAGNRFVAQRTDTLACAPLVRGIAHREHSGDRESFDLRGIGAHRRLDRGLFERLALLPGRLVPAAYTHQHAAGTPESRTLEHLLIETDQQRADGAETALHDRVRGKRRRYRDEGDVLTPHAAGQLREHRADSLAKTDRQVPVSGQSLGRGNDAPLTIERNGISESAASVETEPDLAARGRAALSVGCFVPGPGLGRHVCDAASQACTLLLDAARRRRADKPSSTLTRLNPFGARRAVDGASFHLPAQAELRRKFIARLPQPVF